MAFPGEERRGDVFWSRLEREGVGSDDGGRAFGAQSAPNHWAERGRGRVTGASCASASASDSAVVGVSPDYWGPIWLQRNELAKHGTAAVSALWL